MNRFWNQVTPARGFLLVLVVLTVFISFVRVGFNSSIDECVGSECVHVGRVVEENRTPYNTSVNYVYTHNQLWRVSPKEVLTVGQRYQFSAEFEPFDVHAEDFDSYLRTIGVVGELVDFEPLSVQEFCDWKCRVVQKNQDVRWWLNKKYYIASCKTFKSLNKLFYQGRCENVYGLAYGLILGGTDKFERETYEDIKNLGLSHLVAVSGFQVVLLSSFVDWTSFQAFWLHRRYRVWLVVVSILGLILLAGPQPPILRSGVSMVMAVLVAFYLRREVHPVRLLLYSACIMLWFNPFYLYSVSFQLSFVATFAVIMASNLEDVGLDWEISWIKNLWSAAAVSLLAFLYTLPIIITLNGGVNLLAVPLNTLITPAIPLISVLNVAGLLPVIGGFFLAVSNILQSMLLAVIDLFSTFTSRLPLTTFDFWGYVFYYTILTGIILAIRYYYDQYLAKTD